MFVWPDILERLSIQLSSKSRPWGVFVVGLSIGTLDDDWARSVEVGTSLPSARLRALRNLQQAGVPTYGMLCPVFPDVLEGGGNIEKLIEQIGPMQVEHIWAEPYNDRCNWFHVREGYLPETFGYTWLTQVFDQRQSGLWSKYAATLYLRLRQKSQREGWLHKLRYLLYEDEIVERDAAAFEGFHSVLLQSKPNGDGTSRNPNIAKYQIVQRLSGRRPVIPDKC
ncbi:MAG: hypothetical protein HY646_18725 [Acidobacteria bacterium]|nr:hypothetical protein [Acidobacteriota bacterium]